MRLVPRVLSMLLLAVLNGCSSVAGTAVPPPRVDPRTESMITMEGIVSSVERPRPEDSQAYVHLVVTPADGVPIRLVLAPGWYLDEQGIRLEPRQTVQVSGKRVVKDGQSGIVVQRLRRGDESYILRDEHEQPKWLKQ